MKTMSLLAAYAVAAIGLIYGTVQAQNVLPECSNAYFLSLPATEWEGPPVVKLVGDPRKCVVNSKVVKTEKIKGDKLVTFEERWSALTEDEKQRRTLIEASGSVYQMVDRMLGLKPGTTLQVLRMTPYDGTEAYAKAN